MLKCNNPIPIRALTWIGGSGRGVGRAFWREAHVVQLFEYALVHDGTGSACRAGRNSARDDRTLLDSGPRLDGVRRRRRRRTTAIQQMRDVRSGHRGSGYARYDSAPAGNCCSLRVFADTATDDDHGSGGGGNGGGGDGGHAGPALILHRASSGGNHITCNKNNNSNNNVKRERTRALGIIIRVFVLLICHRHVRARVCKPGCRMFYFDFFIIFFFFSLHNSPMSFSQILLGIFATFTAILIVSLSFLFQIIARIWGPTTVFFWSVFLFGPSARIRYT